MDNDMVVKVNNYTLKQHDFKTLNDGEWLNDMVSSVITVTYLCIPFVSDYKQLHELDYG